MVGIPNVKEQVIKILLKWVTVPLTFLVIALTGAAINMPNQFIKTKDKHQILIDFGFAAVYLGLYSGIIAGIMVDKLSNVVSFIVAAVLALVGFIPCAFITDAEGLVPNLGGLACFFVAGLGGSIGVITSVVSLAKNFDAGKGAYLLVAICITYWKLANGMDNSLHEGFMKEADNTIYFIVVGCVVFVVNILAAFAMTKVELGDILDAISKEADSTGIFIYVIVTALLLLIFFVLEGILGLGLIGSIVFLFFLVLNFLVLALAVYMIYKMIKSGKGVGMGALTGALNKPKELTTGEMFKLKKYIHLCLVSFSVIGVSLSFEDLIIGQGIAGGESAAMLKLALQIYWFSDVLGRFLGGFIVYVTIEKITPWKLIIVFTVIALIGHIVGLVFYILDLAKAGAVIAPAVLVGFGSGAVWSAIPIEILDAGKYKAYGQNWGTVLFFGLLGFLIFNIIDVLTGNNGIIAESIFVFFAILSIVFAILGHSDHQQNHAKKTPGGAQATNNQPKK